MRARLPALLLAGLALAGRAAPLRAESPAAAAQRILADSRFQRGLPGRSSAAEGEPVRPRRPSREPEPLSIPLPDLSGAGPICLLLGEGLLVLAILLLILWVMQRLFLRSASRVAPTPMPQEPAAGEARSSAPSLEEAQLLARQGRYVEALHVLLLAAIQVLAERGKRTLPSHLTSRELARTLPLGPDSRPVFRDLVTAVEGPLFGGDTAGEEDFAHGVERYRTLLEGRPNGA